jgi:hypothetical protein
MKKHTVLKKILLFMIIAAIILGIRLSGLRLPDLENLKLNRNIFMFYVKHYLLSVLLYILIYIIVTGFPSRPI